MVLFSKVCIRYRRKGKEETGKDGKYRGGSRRERYEGRG
jgi:hypothetical protein